MANQEGVSHVCSLQKINISNYKKSIADSGFTDAECRLVLDFYVSKSPAMSSGCSIDFKKFGWKNTTNNLDGFPALEKRLANIAGIPQFNIIRCTTIKNTLKSMDLSNDIMCIEHPRAVMKQDYKVTVTESESIKIISKESRMKALFRHIRNSFAHGNTYFFNNGFCLLEDHDCNGNCSARILIKKQSLIDWIFIVDKSQYFFKSMIESCVPIKEITEDIIIALRAGAFRSALALSLTLPDICAHVEYCKEETKKDDYVNWFNKYVEHDEFHFPLPGFESNTLDGFVCYQLRCAVLHQGNTDVSSKTSINDFLLSLSLANNSTFEYKIKQVDDNQICQTKIDVIKLCQILCKTALNYYDNHPNKVLFEKYSVRIENK